jgi:hypothetical protein
MGFNSAFEGLISSGSEKKEPRYAFSFLSKFPVNEPLPGSPTGPLWRELPFYRAFKHTFQIPHKIFPK